MVKKKDFCIVTILLFSLFGLFNCNDNEIDFLTVEHQMQFIKINTIIDGSIFVAASPVLIEFSCDKDIQTIPDEVSVWVEAFTTDKQKMPLASEKYPYIQEFNSYYPKAEADLILTNLLQNPNYVHEDPSDPKLFDSSKESETATGLEDEVKKAQYGFSFNVPKLEAGLYNLNIEFLAGKKSFGKKSIPFFFAANKIGFSSLEVAPSVAYPDGEALLLLGYLNALNGNEYVCIYLKDELILSGFASQIGEKCIIKAPKAEGIYPLRLEIYPFSPTFVGLDFDEDKPFPFASPFSIKTDLFVSEAQPAFSNELKNSNNNYSMLFHFKGELNNWASDRLATKANVVGNPLLDIDEGFFGYRFNSQNYLEFSQFALPLKKGKLQPFSIHLYAFLPQHKFAPIFYTSSGHFAFTLYGNENRLPALLISNGDKKYISSLPSNFKLRDFSFKPLTLSFYSQDSSSWILWYKDGNLIHKEYLPVVFDTLNGEGTTFIGTDKTASKNPINIEESVIIDELGIYFQNDKGEASIDATVFNQALSRRLKNKLIFCEGFDALSIDGVDLNCSGEVFTKASSFYINGNSVVSKKIEISGAARVNFNIGLHTNSSASLFRLGLAENESNSFFTIDFANGQFIVNDNVVALVKSEGLLNFSIASYEGGLQLLLQDKQFKIDARSMDAITFEFENLKSEFPLILDEIIVDTLEWPQKLINNKVPILYWEI